MEFIDFVTRIELMESPSPVEELESLVCIFEVLTKAGLTQPWWLGGRGVD